MAGEKNKAASKADAPQVSLEHGSMVMAKIPGFGAAWPAFVMANEHVPDAVLKGASKSKPIIVRYPPRADYNYASQSHLTPLTQEDAQKWLDTTAKSKKKQTADLQSAYEICSKDPKAWIKETDEVVEQDKLNAENQDELEEDEDQLQEEKPKKKAAKKEKETKSADGKKRKREEAANGQAKKVEKKTKDSTAAAKKQKTEKTPASATKTAGGDDDDEGESLDPETAKVKNWRHKLQRAFLGKDGTLKAEDMEANDSTFKTVEAYSMTVEQLRISKIGKVMKRIVTLPGTIPREEEFQFRKRADALVNKWGNILSSNNNDVGNDSVMTSKGDQSVVGQEAPSQDKAAASPKNDSTAPNGLHPSSSNIGEEKSQHAPAASAAEPKQDE